MLALIGGLPSKSKSENMMKEKKKKEKMEKKTCFELFCTRKNGDCSRKFRWHQAMTARSAAQTASPPKTSRENFGLDGLPCKLHRTTLVELQNISTTCTYYREILTLGTLRSSRTTEYYVLLNLCTIEKGKTWIWISFQSGPPFFVGTIENYVLLSVRNFEKWL